MGFPAMLKFLPAGWIGLMVGGLVAANSSTILTHLNWGASYLVHDFYQRFVRKGETEQHYVRAGRIATIILFVLSSSLVFVLDSALESFNIILQVGAGTGLLYLLRWYWWRITAWCELMAMISSFGMSVLFLVLTRSGILIGTSKQLIGTIAVTTLVWVLTAFIGPQTDKAKLIEFYKTVRPFGPGWACIRKEAGVTDEEAAHYNKKDNIPLAMLGWVAGCAMIWSGLFTVGNLLYGRMGYTAILTVVFVISTASLIGVTKRLWA
jgi:Na+/proline symporter